VRKNELIQWGDAATQAVRQTAARFHMRLEVTAIRFGPSVVRFTLAQGKSYNVADVLKRERDLAQALRVDPSALSMEQTARGIVLSIPSPSPYVVDRAGIEGHGLSISLGTTADGARTYHLGFSNVVTNLLIVAPTRTGKTTLLRTLVYGLAAQNSEHTLHLVLIDPKGDDLLASFNALAHLRYPLAVGIEEATAILQDLAQEVEARQVNKRRKPLIFVIVDEVIALVGHPQYGLAILDSLTAITTRGGGLGIYTIASTQRADKRSMRDPLVVSQFTNRLVGRVANGMESALATGHDGLACHKLLGRGDFMAIVGGQVTRLQVVPTSESLIARLPVGVRAELPELQEPTPPASVGRPKKPISEDDLATLAGADFDSLRGIQRLLSCGRGRAIVAAQEIGRLDLLPEGRSI